MKKRITSAIIALILCLTLLPATVLATEPDTRHTIQLGASAINGWSADDGYDYIYLGNWNNKPVKWRVLSANGDGATFYRDETSAAKYGASALFLLSEYVQDSKQFRSSRSSNRWRGSTTENWCDTFNAGAFTSIESRALLTTSSSSAKKDAGEPLATGRRTILTQMPMRSVQGKRSFSFLPVKLQTQTMVLEHRKTERPTRTGG